MPHRNFNYFQSREKRRHNRSACISPLRLERCPAWVVLTLLLIWIPSQAVKGQEIPSVLDGPILDVNGKPIEATPIVIAEPSDLTATSSKTAPRENEQPQNVDAGEKIDALITKIVLKNIPHEFNEDKDWGGQAPRFNGVNFRRDGLKIRTNRKRKMVNHGTWKKYDVSLLDPKDQFSISVKNMREAEEGKMAFDVYVSANLKIDGRQANWVKGVQLYNVSLDGKAKVDLKATIELRTLMDVTKFPPDLVFRPEAKAVEMSVQDFRIDRISKVGGEVTQQITRIARGAIESRLEKEEAKTVKKLNAEFSKNADKLRLSLHDAMSNKWSAAAKKFMPTDVKKALEDQ